MHFESVNKFAENIECKECGKTFCYLFNLQKYVNFVHRKFDLKSSLPACGVYRKSENFGCRECSKNFAHKWHLTSHMKFAHRNVHILECRKCGKQFDQKRRLYAHIDFVHKRVKNVYRELGVEKSDKKVIIARQCWRKL